jgi:Ala-tRNA(Pro) deacylase
MFASQLNEFLDRNQVKYVTTTHSSAYKPYEVEQSERPPGSCLVKTVLVKLDGRLAMAVVPAGQDVDFERLQAAAGVSAVEYAPEWQFAQVFPGCEEGAIPPFGNLYCIEVYADEFLGNENEIAFHCGTQRELIRMSFADFKRLARPTIAEIVDPVAERRLGL